MKCAVVGVEETLIAIDEAVSSMPEDPHPRSALRLCFRAHRLRLPETKKCHAYWAGGVHRGFEY